MATVKLSFDFDSYEEQDDFQIQCNAQKMYDIITTLDSALRATYKHDDKIDDHTTNLIEGWRSIIAESMVLDL